MQAAIGIIQLRKIHVRNAVRVKYASIIYQAFEEHSEVFRLPKLPKSSNSAWYRVVVYIRPEGIKDGFSREDIIDKLNTKIINVNSGPCPEIYLENCFQKSFFSVSERLPIAKKLGETSLSICINSNIPIEIINRFSGTIKAVGKEIKKVV